MDFPQLFSIDEIDGAVEKKVDTVVPIFYTSAPDFLIEQLGKFDRIAKTIILGWGTIQLKNFLNDLLNDTRDHTRQGFPSDVASALLKLSLENIKFLEHKGLELSSLEKTEFDNQPSTTGWIIPRNF